MADPRSALFGVKRLLGKARTVDIAGSTSAPEDMAAAIIDKVRHDAERYLGFDVDRAVITVPARYGDPQRRAVRDAATRAGLKAARIMNEPSAAALARAWTSARDEAERLVLVYDFGGGTFDATVLRARGGSCAVLSSEGDDALGGMDIDTAMYQMSPIGSGSSSASILMPTPICPGSSSIYAKRPRSSCRPGMKPSSRCPSSAARADSFIRASR